MEEILKKLLKEILAAIANRFSGELSLEFVSLSLRYQRLLKRYALEIN
jgi:hypothetical protein